MAKLNPPNSTAVVDVPGELLGRYEAAGWVKVKAEESTKKSKK